LRWSATQCKLSNTKKENGCKKEKEGRPEEKGHQEEGDQEAPRLVLI
jgi:hypothetical protein